jgi:hypothetical protein
VLRGFPITIGLAAAFLIMFISVPVLRLVSLVRREKSADVPLVTDVAAYHEVAERVVQALNRHGLELRASEPSWWVKAPTRILAWFGGAAFSGFVPQRLEHFTAPHLELSFYTSGILLRGAGPRVTWAHGLIAETAVHSSGFETMSGPAQDVERDIRRLWKIVDDAPEAHASSAPLLARVGEIARVLGTIDVDYEEWSVLYRQLLQVERAVRGERQLLDASATPKSEVKDMSDETTNTKAKVATSTPNAPTRGGSTPPHQEHAGPQHLSTSELLEEIVRQSKNLVTAQIELAKAELRNDLSREETMVAGLGVAALAALLAVTLLLVTGILALATVLPAWLAGLGVSGAILVVAVVAGVVGWGKRVRRPLARTRHEIEHDVNFAKERVA